MPLDLLAEELFKQQIIYYKKIRRYDQDYDLTYKELTDEQKDGFLFYAAWIITNKHRIFPDDKVPAKKNLA